MKISLLFFWLLLFRVWSRRYFKHVDDQVNYKITVQVIDYQWYSLAGIILNIKYGNQPLGNKNMQTDDSGTVILTGRFTKQNSYSLSVNASTQFNSITQTTIINGIAESPDLIKFDSIVQFNQSDVKTNDVFLLGTIYLRTFSNNNPLPDTIVDITALYQEMEGNLTQQIKFSAISNKEGQKTVHFLIPPYGSPLNILYTASKNGYWNEQKLKHDLVLWPYDFSLIYSQQDYKLTVNVKLTLGQFYLVLTALVNDKNAKALSDAKLQISDRDLGSNQILDHMNALSGEDGKITASVLLKASPIIHLKVIVSKNNYINYVQVFNLTFDLNVKINSITHDLGIVQLQNAEDIKMSGAITIFGTLIDEEKLQLNLVGLPLTLNLKRCDPVIVTQMLTQSTVNETYSFSVETFIGENYEAIINVDGQPYFYVANVSLLINGEKKEQSINKDITLKRILVDCIVAGSLVDYQNQPILKAEIKILSSFPEMKKMQIYNQSVTASQGAFTLPFQCYNQVQTILNIQMQSKEYPESVLLTPQRFICGEKQINLMPIVLPAKTVKITITGTMKDNNGVTNGIKRADVKISLTPSDPFTTALETTTDSNGKYQLSFKAVQNQIYQIVLSATNPDFDSYKSPSFQIIAENDQIITMDGQLNRTVIQTTVNITIQNDNGFTPHDTQIKVDNIHPAVENISSSTCQLDTSGKCTIKISCYKNTKVNLVIDVLATSCKEVKTDQITFNCDTKPINLQPIIVKLVPTNIKLILSGILIGPKGTGQSDVPIKIVSDPVTRDFETQTGSDGKWSLINNQLEFNIKYEIIEQFSDGSGQSHQNIQTFQAREQQSTLEFPIQYFDDFLQFQLNGKLITKEAVLVSNAQIILQCADTIGKNGKPINQTFSTDLSGTFEFQWEMLINMNSKIDCLLTSLKTKKFKQTSLKFQVTPNTQRMRFTIQVDLSHTFKAQLRKHYQFTTIRGTVVAECKQADNLIVWKGLEDVQIIVKQWDGQRFVNLGYSAMSGKDGDYNFKMQILKNHIQNEIQLLFIKQSYIPTDSELSLQSTYLSSDGSFLIESQRILMVRNGGPKDCRYTTGTGSEGNGESGEESDGTGTNRDQGTNRGQGRNKEKRNQERSSSSGENSSSTSPLILILILALALTIVLALALALKLAVVLLQPQNLQNQQGNVQANIQQPGQQDQVGQVDPPLQHKPGVVLPQSNRQNDG